jgi:hypothetical protein
VCADVIETGLVADNGDASGADTPGQETQQNGQFWKAANDASLHSSSTVLKKLTCQLCRNTIADNPKSIGIRTCVCVCASANLRVLQT